MGTVTLISASALTLVLLFLLPSGRQVLRSCLSVDTALLTFTPGLRAALGMFVVLAATQSVRQDAWATPMALGVLLTMLSDFAEPYPQRARVMTRAAVALALSVLIGGWVSATPSLHVAVGLLIAWAVGYAVTVGPRATLVGLYCLAIFSVYSGSPLAPSRGLIDAVACLVAGLLSVPVACLAWPFARYHPTRRKLAVAFRQLAAACRDQGSRAADIRLVVAIQAARGSVVGSEAGGATRAWFDALLTAIESCRVVVVAMAPTARQAVSMPTEVWSSTRATARLIERWLTFGAPVTGLAAAIRPLTSACERCTDPHLQLSMRALEQQLLVVMTLLEAPWPIGRHASPRQSSTFGEGLIQSLRLHLHWKDLQMRHAVKFALTYAVGTLLALGPMNIWLDRHGFWIPLTVVWVCKPDVAGSVSRFSMRLCGTVLGVLLSAWLLHLITDPMWLAVLTALGAFLMAAMLFANYSLTVLGVTVLVLALAAATGTYTEELADARMLATLLGCGLVLLSAYVMPVRSGTTAPVHLARMSRRLREALHSRLAQTGGSSDPRRVFDDLQRDRLAAVTALAAANAEPRAPWEHADIGIKLRALADRLIDLEHVCARLQWGQLVSAAAQEEGVDSRTLESLLDRVDQQLAAR